ncbi:hypothetical protein [Caudoviricetes sp.]|nr:hypothetical protein [Caudoviricetes sp.]
MEEDRSLTDEDIKALVDELENRLQKRFYLNLGKGLWSIMWRFIILGMVVIAAIGSYKGNNLL